MMNVITITAAGACLDALEKAIRVGANFVLVFSKVEKAMKAGVNLVNGLFERLGINLRLRVTIEGRIEAILGAAVVGAALGGGAALLMGIPLLWPVIIGAVVAGAAESIVVERANVVSDEDGNQMVIVDMK